jgi:hypothetical protein
MSDLTTVLADLSTYLGNEDQHLRPKVLSYCISNLGAFTKEVKQAVEQSVKQTDPVLWNFGMSMGYDFREMHLTYMECVREEVQIEFNLDVDRLRSVFEDADGPEWNPF